MRTFFARQPHIGEWISASVMPKSAGNITPLSAAAVLQLSWTHFIELIRLHDPLKRAFYDNKARQKHQ